MTPPTILFHAGDRELSGVPTTVAQVIGREGKIAGAGFLIDDSHAITCAHVVDAAGYNPGERIEIAFPHLDGAPRIQATVLSGSWRSPEAEDVAILELESHVPSAKVLALGSAEHCREHRVCAFGFPARAPSGGQFGYGSVSGIIPDVSGAGALLQLSNANDLTTGFSGSPVLDEVTGLVVGMVNSISAPDANLKGLGIAYATPTQILCEVWPNILVQDQFPYQDLEPFTAADAQWFHGREAAIDKVLANLAAQPQVLLLLGPSGAGKSSLVQAGVLPALAEGRIPAGDRWLPVLTRPGHDLLAELERTLPGVSTDGIAAAAERRLAGAPEYERVLLIIDQFEELLVLPATNSGLTERTSSALEQVTETVGSSTVLSLVLVMRDDFYPRLAAVAPALIDAAAPSMLNLPATLSRQDLHAIITQPAQIARARFENGLPERIITDVLAASPLGTTAMKAPATLLPPLELALSQLWQRRHDGILTHDAYQRIGEIDGSLTTWCNTAINNLSEPQKLTARRILTALVRPADESLSIPAARQQVPLAALRELAGGTANSSVTDEVFDHLTRQRIITTHTTRISAEAPGEPVAELIHDTLITNWTELRNWIRDDHQFQDWLRRAREQHARWAESVLSDDLLDGTDLAEGLTWAKQRSLPNDIIDFLAASRKNQHARRQRDKRFIVALTIALSLAILAAGLTFWQRQEAVAAQQIALSRQLAAQSDTLREADPDLASLLAIHAYKISPTTEARASLYSASSNLSRRLTNHAGPVISLAFSPDGRTIATGTSDEEPDRVWNIATRRSIASVRKPSGVMTSVAFSHDGRTLAISSNDEVQLQGIPSGHTKSVLSQPRGGVASVVFGPHDQALAIDGNGHVWDMASHQIKATLAGHMFVEMVAALSPDGRTLATSQYANKTQIWDLNTGRLRTTLVGDTSSFTTSMAFSLDGQTLATGNSDGTVRLWNVSTHYTIATLIGHTGSVTSMAFSPDKQTLATGSNDQTVRLWNVTTHHAKATLIGHTGSVTSVAFSPDGRTLASGSNDQTIRLWNVPAQAKAILMHPGEQVMSVAFSRDGDTLASLATEIRDAGGADNRLRLWNLHTDRATTNLEVPCCGQSVTFGPNGRTLAVATGEGVQLRNAIGNIRNLPADSQGVDWVALSPDGRSLASGSDDGTVQLRDMTTGHSRTLAQNLSGPVMSLAFSPDSQTLAVGENLWDPATSSINGTVQLWNVATGHAEREIRSQSIENLIPVAFSPDGRTLATSNGGEVQLWNAVSLHAEAQVSSPDQGVTSLVFSPDGRTLATGSEDGSIQLLDLATGYAPVTFAEHTDTVESMAFSPNGRTLATGSQDGTVRLWNATLPDADQAIKKICESVQRDLTVQEWSVYLPSQTPKSLCTP